MTVLGVISNSKKHGVIYKTDDRFVFMEGDFDEWGIVKGVEKHGKWAALCCAIGDVDGIGDEVIKN